ALLNCAAGESGGALAQLIDVGAHRIEPGPRHAVAQRADLVAHAAPGIVERPAAGARGRAAAAAARLLALHLAVRPRDELVELSFCAPARGGDGGAPTARTLLQPGRARACRLLAGDQAPPEAVAEANRPDRQEDVEWERDEPLAQMPLGPEGLAQHQPHQE